MSSNILVTNNYRLTRDKKHPTKDHGWSTSASKKSSGNLGKQRGQLTVSHEKKAIIEMIQEAQNSGAKQSTACEIIGISRKTLQRWSQLENLQDGRIEAE